MTDEAQRQPAAAWTSWLPVLAEAVLLGLLALRYAGTDLLPGQLLPCLALGLAPGSAAQLLGRRSLPFHRAGLALGLIAFLISDGTLQIDRLPAALSRGERVLPGLALIALQPIFGAWRWHRLLQAHEIDLGLKRTLRLNLIATFFNAFVPGATGGDLFRIYAVTRDSRRMGAAVGSIVLDRLTGLPPLLLLVLLGAVANWRIVADKPILQTTVQLAGLAAGAVLLLVGILTALALRGNHWIEHHGRWLPRRETLLDVCRRLEAIRSQKHLLREAFLVSLLAHCCTIAACVLFADAAGAADIPTGLFLLIVPAGMCINAIPASPGGIGQGETAFARIFAVVSAAPGSAAAGATVMLLQRLGQFTIGLLGGLLYALGRADLQSASPASSSSPDLAQASSGDAS